MEQNKNISEFARTVMEGLELAVQKLKEEAKKNKQPLVVSIDGKVKLIYLE